MVFFYIYKNIKFELKKQCRQNAANSSSSQLFGLSGSVSGGLQNVGTGFDESVLKKLHVYNVYRFFTT